MLYLMVVATAIVVLLVGVAGFLHWKLYWQNVRRDKALGEEKKRVLENRKEALKSIVILARGFLAEQVSATEVSIRISVLLEALALPDKEKEDFVSFYKLAEATSHIPILAAWKALSKKEQRQFDKERMKHEEQYHDFIVAGAERVLSKESDFFAHIETL
ncbi:DUF2489 domain-containing protein [Teredinibacter purpureus]|uniref:DUF2489 domain-containing protein n=1 Tax=Teredinibacter purpureus TaxID=2731756 RepID=UPI0005F87E6D|nr:DUF2489 domain-containing protein [Teredinibacter purpureus]